MIAHGDLKAPRKAISLSMCQSKEEEDGEDKEEVEGKRRQRRAKKERL